MKPPDALEMKPEYRIFLLLSLVFVLSILPLFFRADFKLIDFEVYHRAGERCSQGLKLYAYEEDGHYTFKYSPVFAMLMIPLSWLDLKISSLIYLCIVFLALFKAIAALGQEMRLSHWLALFFLILIFAKHSNKEIYLGQINALNRSFLVLSVYYARSHFILSLILFLISLFIKPFGLVLLTFFVMKYRYKWAILFMIVSLLFICFSFFWIDSQSYLDWMAELKKEIFLKTDLVPSDTLIAFFTGVLNLPKTLGVILGVGLWLVIVSLIYTKERQFFPYLVISTIPLIICTTNNFYIYSIPVYVLALARFHNFSFWAKLIFTISAFLMIIPQYELWGRAGVDLIEQYTPYAISVLLAFASLFLYTDSSLDFRSSPISSSFERRDIEKVK